MSLLNLKSFFQKSEREARRRSREIDAMLKREKREPVMMFVMSSHRGGVSTFIKQIRIIHGYEFSHNELLEFREAVYGNIIQGMDVLIQERNKLDIPLQKSANEMHEALFKPYDFHTKLEPSTFQPFVAAVDSLWKDSGIQEAHLRRTNFEFYESVKYYFDNIHRIGQLNYLPNNQDILYAQKRFSNAAEIFVLQDFGIMDFLWFRLRRSKFCFCCFSPYVVNPLLYIIGSSDYDQNSYNEENGLIESLNHFERVCKDKHFCSHIILFFNKMDLLAEKIQTTDIRKHFPDFKGEPNKLEDVQKFLVQMFKKRQSESRNVIFYHMITAVDTDNVRTVFDTVKDTVMGRNLGNIPVL